MLFCDVSFGAMCRHPDDTRAGVAADGVAGRAHPRWIRIEDALSSVFATEDEARGARFRAPR